MLGRGAAGCCALAPVSPVPSHTHHLLTGHRCTCLRGRQSITNGQGMRVTPAHQDPCTAPGLPQALAQPSSSRFRGSLQGWGSRGADKGGRESGERPGKTWQGGGGWSPILQGRQMRPSHLIGHSCLLPINLVSPGKPLSFGEAGGSLSSLPDCLQTKAPSKSVVSKSGGRGEWVAQNSRTWGVGRDGPGQRGPGSVRRKWPGIAGSGVEGEVAPGNETGNLALGLKYSSGLGSNCLSGKRALGPLIPGVKCSLPEPKAAPRGPQ